MTVRYLVTGAKGQVGGALCARLGASAIPVDVAEMDLAKPETIAATLARYKPDAILNPAAWTAVDKAEAEESFAQKVNADAVREIARYAFAQHIPLVHYSTDYVFPGSGTAPWEENDTTGPLNAYGRTKLAGEQAIFEEAEKYPGAEFLIFRLSWVYAEAGHNFVNTMLRLGAEREVLSVVDDQIGAPTYAGDIADATLAALTKATASQSGIYHMVNSGYTSWYGFAEEIFRQVSELGADLAVREVKPQATRDYPTPAKRPLNSRMDCSKLKATFGITMPSWQDALARCLHHKVEHHDHSNCSHHHH